MSLPPHTHRPHPSPPTLLGLAFCQVEQKGPEAQALGSAPPPCARSLTHRYRNRAWGGDIGSGQDCPAGGGGRGTGAQAFPVSPEKSLMLGADLFQVWLLGVRWNEKTSNSASVRTLAGVAQWAGHCPVKQSLWVQFPVMARTWAMSLVEGGAV